MEKTPQKLLEQFNKISFYVVAHADDWQLFMQPNVYRDVVAHGCKVVLIITTAGDAGMGDNYWPAREEGSKSSVRFCLASLSVFSEYDGDKKFNNHCIHYWSAHNTTSYFLRLPDGNLDANGFPTCNFQSLLKFKLGQINAINAIDNSTTYPSWADLVTTIESIIDVESEDIPNRWIHYQNPDTTVNPNDHPDHIMTGRAIQSMTIITSLYQLLFVGYSVSSVAGKLALTDLFWKAGIFAAYEKAVYDLCGYSTLREDSDLYVSWCSCKPGFLEISPTL